MPSKLVGAPESQRCSSHRRGNPTARASPGEAKRPAPSPHRPQEISLHDKDDAHLIALRTSKNPGARPKIGPLTTTALPAMIRHPDAPRQRPVWPSVAISSTTLGPPR